MKTKSLVSMLFETPDSGNRNPTQSKQSDSFSTAHFRAGERATEVRAEK